MNISFTFMNVTFNGNVCFEFLFILYCIKHCGIMASSSGFKPRVLGRVGGLCAALTLLPESFDKWLSAHKCLHSIMFIS